MRRLAQLLMLLGVLLGGAIGVAILLGVSLPGLSWFLAVGLAKLTLIGSGGLLAGGALLQRLANRRDDRARLSSRTEP
jgi:hypothetical protein